jgi:hypothetical protein
MFPSTHSRPPEYSAGQHPFHVEGAQFDSILNLVSPVITTVQLNKAEIANPIHGNNGTQATEGCISHNQHKLTPTSAELYTDAVAEMLRKLQAIASDRYHQHHEQAKQLLNGLGCSTQAPPPENPADATSFKLQAKDYEAAISAMVRKPENAGVFGIENRFKIAEVPSLIESGDPDFLNFINAFDQNKLFFTENATDPINHQLSNGDSSGGETKISWSSILTDAIACPQNGRFSNVVLARLMISTSNAGTTAEPARELLLLLRSGEKKASVPPKSEQGATDSAPATQERKKKLFSITENFQKRLPNATAATGIWLKIMTPLRAITDKKNEERSALHAHLEAAMRAPTGQILELPGEMFKAAGLDEEKSRHVPRHKTQKSGQTNKPGEANDRLLDTEHMLLNLLKDWQQWRVQREDAEYSVALEFYTHLPPCSSCDLGIYASLFDKSFDFIKQMHIYNGTGKLKAAQRNQASITENSNPA